MPNASLLNKILRAVLVGAAVFDLIVGFLVLLAPGLIVALMKLPLPAEAYVLFIGLLQIGVSLGYVIGCISPVRHIGNVMLAAVMRLAMSVVLIFIGITMGLPLFILLAVVEILLGLSHALYAMRLRSQPVSF